MVKGECAKETGTGGVVPGPRIFVSEVDSFLSEQAALRASSLLPQRRREKADAQRTPLGRAASLTAGLLAEEAKVREGFGGCHVLYGESGQPFLGSDNALHRGYLSLSHSGRYAACAACAAPVGIDLQKRTAVKKALLMRICAPGECGDWKRAEEGEYAAESGSLDAASEGASCFFRVWTAKESYMKLTGEGIGLGFDTLRVKFCGEICQREGLPDGSRDAPWDGSGSRDAPWDGSQCVRREDFSGITREGYSFLPVESGLWVCRPLFPAGTVVDLKARYPGATLWAYSAPEGYFLSACTWPT